MNPYQPGEDNQDPYEVGYKAGAASRDAEVVSLMNQRDYEYVRAENSEQERDQLREQVKMLRDGRRKDWRNEMTTHDRNKIIAAAKEAGFQVIFDGKFGRDDYFSSMASIPSVERFYAIAFEAGRQAELDAANKDAKRYRFIRDNPWNGTDLDSVITCHLNAVWDLAIDEAIRARGDRK